MIDSKENISLFGQKIGRVVALEDSPTFEKVTVRLDAGRRVRPGELLVVPCNLEGSRKDFIILRVSGAREFNEYENPMDSQVRDMFNMNSVRGRDDLLRKFVLADTQPLEMVLQAEEEKLITQDPTQLVHSGTEVYKLTSGVAGSLLGFPEPGGPSSMVLGDVVGESGIKVVLDANKCLPRHMLIVGSTGTGKSYFIGVISEELQRLGIRHINIDIHGEMVKASSEMGGSNVLPGKELTVKLSSLSEPEVMEMLPITNDLHKDIAIKAFSNLKKTGKDFGIQEYKDEARSVAVSYGSKQNTMDIMDARIQTLESISILGKGYDWITALEKGGALVNIDCREISSHTELKIIVGSVAREVMNLRKKEKIKQLVLSMDEAHMFLPAGETSPSSHVLGELIRFGRHHGVGIIIASQSPNDIDRRIAKITNTRAFFAIEKTEIGSVTGLLADTPDDIIDSLSRLKTGTCLLVGARDIIKHAQIVQVRKRTSTHGGETPKMIK